MPQRKRRDATKIDEVREALESHARLLSAHRSKRATTSLADDILESIEARNDEVLTEEAILAVLGDAFGFPLDKDGARALCRACENDPSVTRRDRGRFPGDAAVTAGRRVVMLRRGLFKAGSFRETALSGFARGAMVGCW